MNMKHRLHKIIVILKRDNIDKGKKCYEIINTNVKFVYINLFNTPMETYYF